MNYKLLLILLTFPLSVFSQKIEEDTRTFQGMFFLGINPSQVDGDGLNGFYQFGLSAGPAVAVKVKNRFFFNMELLYNSVGSAWNPNQEMAPGQNYRLKLRYAAVPLYLNYHDKDGKVRLGAGLSYGRMFAATEEMNFLPVEDALGSFKRSDICGLADLQYLFSKNWGVNLRFSNSLPAIRHFNTSRYNGRTLGNAVNGINQYNKYLTVRIFYVF
jgi:hypothetical protein